MSERTFGDGGLVAVELLGPIREIGVRRYAVLDGIAGRGNPPGLGAVYGRIVGWKYARRGYVFPAAQFDNRSRPVPGLDHVVGQYGDGYAVWMWLTTPQPSLDDATPLTLLEWGETDRVADAVRGELQGDFT